MDRNAIISLIITGSLGLSIVALSIVFLTGRGAFLLAGYNTMPKSEQEKYDGKALCKFMGKILLPIGIFTPAVSLGGIFEISWVVPVYVVGVFALLIFAAVYANTGNRFKR